MREKLSAVEETSKDILNITLNITKHLANHTEQFVWEVKDEIDSAGYYSGFVDDVAHDAIESYTEPVFRMSDAADEIDDLVEEIDEAIQEAAVEIRERLFSNTTKLRDTIANATDTILEEANKTLDLVQEVSGIVEDFSGTMDDMLEDFSDAIEDTEQDLFQALKLVRIQDVNGIQQRLVAQIKRSVLICAVSLIVAFIVFAAIQIYTDKKAQEKRAFVTDEERFSLTTKLI